MIKLLLVSTIIFITSFSYAAEKCKVIDPIGWSSEPECVDFQRCLNLRLHASSKIVGKRTHGSRFTDQVQKDNKICLDSPARGDMDKITEPAMRIKIKAIITDQDVATAQAEVETNKRVSELRTNQFTPLWIDSIDAIVLSCGDLDCVKIIIADFMRYMKAKQGLSE